MADSAAPASGSERSVLRRIVLPAACVLAVALFALALLVPRATYGGPEMDEGSVLAYADRVLDGAVPHRDFSTFYGPGNVWLVAGAFAVLEPSITVERAIGVAYRLLIVLSLLVLGWRLAGLAAGALAGAVAATVLPDEVPWAYATYGAVAFGLLSLALVAVGVGSEGRRLRVLLLGAGLAGGVGALMRFDFTVAIVVAAIPLLLLAGRRGFAWFGGGLLLTGGLYLPHLAVVGTERIARTVSDIVSSGPGRELPLPRPWMQWGDLVTSLLLLTPLLIVVGALLVRADRRDERARIVLAVGLFGACLVPWVLSRPDITHVAPAAVVPLSMLPAVVLLLVRSAPWAPRRRTVLAGAVVAVTAVAVVANTEREYRIDPETIENRGRAFYPSAQDPIPHVTAILRELERRSQPGDSVYVGPLDLRRMNYGATYVYFLLPQLEPASYYMEMNPFTANREGSGFADELRAADWLVLTSQWDDWEEPNDSVKYGPAEPNQVVRELFCRRLRSGGYRLYERCDRGVGA